METSNNENFNDSRQLGFWEKNAVIVKLSMIGFLSLLLLVPSAMIQNLISERTQTRDEAVKDIYAKWGKEQTVAGLILNVPYRVVMKDRDGKEEVSLAFLHFLPEQLAISGKIVPTIRYRGIYKAILYNARLKFGGRFSQPDVKGLKVNPESILWEDAFLTLGISDLRGIKDVIKLTINGKTYGVNPGVENGGVFHSGVTIPFAIDQSMVVNAFNFNFDMDLNGSKKISFWPLGTETKVVINSNWNSPSFSGAFLPEKRDITENGFNAEWKVLELNRNFPQKWVGDQYGFEDASEKNVVLEDSSRKINTATDFTFGVNLIMPVDFYQKVSRSAKYAIMFIALTFTAFFFIEIVNKKRIHPIQYILVGMALVIFYSLLLSLTEQIPFNFAYMISSGVTIALISWYSYTILKSLGLMMLMGIILSGLYVFLFVLLQLQDYALLMGSIGLFVILSLIMLVSRQIDWYNIKQLNLG
ncbi:cell envelope integrity protein CreD [Solitalea koreensis]|uniref:Inner membrane protein n=1 Tax=Solitalea koreensis TaxID=543615 RepID=A0A521DRX6_9SPHI|nr:cell envelope integrity protein CreD [Solitalea koreensis]SMO74368.1 inner membrane protein [Solitalea koreensis]